MSEYEIRIEGYLPRSVNATPRLHWARKKDERTFWEASIALEMWKDISFGDCYAFSAATEGTRKRWVEVHLEKPGKIKIRDKDNRYASIKHLLDAMVNLGLLVDDAEEWLDLRGVEESNGHKKYATVIRFGDYDN